MWLCNRGTSRLGWVLGLLFSILPIPQPTLQWVHLHHSCISLFLLQVINHKLYKSRVEFDNAVDQVLEEFSVDIVCLAGFMRILSGPFVRKWDGK